MPHQHHAPLHPRHHADATLADAPRPATDAPAADSPNADAPADPTAQADTAPGGEPAE